MSNSILFCCNPLNTKEVDTDWQSEYALARKNDMPTLLLNYDQLTSLEDINQAIINFKKPSTQRRLIYRGWMMPVNCYEKLYQELLAHNYELINNPDEYKHCYYLPESYQFIKDFTPLTVISQKTTLPSVEELRSLLKPFANNAVIVKDYVKSQKHHWDEACFIANANDTENAHAIVKRFLELQGDNIQGGLVFRLFVELEPIGVHTKSQMPLTKEYRLFVLNHKIISVNPYWSDFNYINETVPTERFDTLLKKIKNHFFTADIAKTRQGDWIIIELGDGQVAEYQDASSLDQFYQQLASYTGL